MPTGKKPTFRLLYVGTDAKERRNSKQSLEQNLKSFLLKKFGRLKISPPLNFRAENFFVKFKLCF